jgi:NAD(P)-dependent dehydrogenase (short-subunit alcohol dehydrogenase family)
LSARGFDAIANIVFHGTFYVTQSVGKKWLELKMKGSIISILATWVWTGSPFVVPSAMSKSALNTMTKSLAVEWGPNGIRVNAIAPGPFPTEGAWARLSPKGDLDDSNSMSTIPMGRVGEMSELQNLATFLMADGCEYLTGQTIALDGAQYLSGGGTFSQLAKMSEDDWSEIRNMIKKTNDSDKQKRST